MSRNLSVTEPHPSVVKSGYIGSGRGGVGNYGHYEDGSVSDGPTATGPPARASLTRPAKRTVYSGRGGAGNAYKASAASEELIFQFDEELKRRSSVAPVFYSIGRGGGGNFVNEAARDGRPRSLRAGSGESIASADSDRSTASRVGDAFGRLTRRISKQ
ncbi:Protein of unknown function (DUF3602) [Teratosphaeria destructans]|uniref:Uncharacterized protein n=1 Tax=Teratosphaeria destructans TaxID=418781 RepID=A0A9W7SU04_9PEZI|nr:Protein of unknown function (DUF3602) [Teratosphaeria destructans]